MPKNPGKSTVSGVFLFVLFWLNLTQPNRFYRGQLGDNSPFFRLYGTTSGTTTGTTFRHLGVTISAYGFTTSFSIKGRQLILLKPSTFMNLSGLAVRYWMQKENIPLENVLIVVDDLALPFGTLRLKGKGSDAGHNGLKHIAATLGTQNYARLRFGIGSDFPRGGQIDYVLGHFTDEDWKTMDERLEMAGEIIKSFCLAGIDITMNQFNKK